MTAENLIKAIANDDVIEISSTEKPSLLDDRQASAEVNYAIFQLGDTRRLASRKIRGYRLKLSAPKKTHKFAIQCQHLCEIADFLGLPTFSSLYSPVVWYKQAMENPTKVVFENFDKATPNVRELIFLLQRDNSLEGFPLHPGSQIIVKVGE